MSHKRYKRATKEFKKYFIRKSLIAKVNHFTKSFTEMPTA